MSHAALTARLHAFYAKHNPEKLSNVTHVAERYLHRQSELCARLERKYGAGAFGTAENMTLEEHAEPVASPGGSCKKMSIAEYAESGRVQTEAALEALVAEMQNGGVGDDVERRLTRSRKRSLVRTAKGLLGRLYDGAAAKDKRAQEVNDLAEKIINTHYYYHGKLSAEKKKKYVEGEVSAAPMASPRSKTNKENTTVFATATPTGVQRPRPDFLNDLLKKPNLKKSGFINSTRSVRPRPNFLSELTNKKSSGLRKVEKSGDGGAPLAKKRSLSLLDEIKLKALQARKDTGMNRSPGMTPLKPKSAARRASLGPNGGLRNALEEALAKRFHHIHMGDAASPAMSDISDF